MTPAPVPDPKHRPNLLGLELAELSRFVSAYGAAPYHGRQVYRWLYSKRAFDPAAWSDLSLGLRSKIAADATVFPGRIRGRVEAGDGTVKLRVRLADRRDIECVRMLQGGRITLCVSSQVGCALACEFCLTGKMGLRRHLTAGEIVGQVALMLQDGVPDDERFNIVFMGMGEPLHNYDGVVTAIRLLADADGFGLSRRRITVSTSGLVPAIERLARETILPRLAVSLNATTDDVRSRLMPVNRRWNIARLLEACRGFAAASGERVTLEYVLLDGINDSDEDVERLSSLARRLPAKLNLIPFNAVPDRLPYRSPGRKRIVAFRDRLLRSGAATSIRWSRGADARAACGQLAVLDETA